VRKGGKNRSREKEETIRSRRDRENKFINVPGKKFMKRRIPALRGNSSPITA